VRSRNQFLCGLQVEPAPDSTLAANANLRKLRLGRADGLVALTTRARPSKEIRKFRARRDELQDKQYRGLSGADPQPKMRAPCKHFDG